MQAHCCNCASKGSLVYTTTYHTYYGDLIVFPVLIPVAHICPMYCQCWYWCYPVLADNSPMYITSQIDINCCCCDEQSNAVADVCQVTSPLTPSPWSHPCLQIPIKIPLLATPDANAGTLCAHLPVCLWTFQKVAHYAKPHSKSSVDTCQWIWVCNNSRIDCILRTHCATQRQCRFHSASTW